MKTNAHPRSNDRSPQATRNVVLTPEQVRSLLDATGNQPAFRDLHDAAMVILRSGIGPNELARLRWTDFLFGVRVMRVKDPKTGNTQGTIMGPETVALLQARRDRVGEAEFVMGSHPAQVVARVASQFRTMAKTLDLPGSDLHILRRTARSGTIAWAPPPPRKPEDVDAHFRKMERAFEDEMPIDFDGAKDWIFCECGSYDKIPALLHLHGQIDFCQWLSLLGEFWTGSDNIGVHSEDLLWIFREGLDDPHTVIAELMDDEERAVYDALPDEITIYRGCGPVNKNGFSWSLDREAAAWFPFSARSKADHPVLLTAKVPKTRVAAAKLRGTEREIIVVELPETAWTEEMLTEEPVRQRQFTGEETSS